MKKRNLHFFHFPPLNNVSINFTDLMKKFGYFAFFFLKIIKIFLIKKNFFSNKNVFLNYDENFFFEKNKQKKMTCKLSNFENDYFYFPKSIHARIMDSPSPHTVGNLFCSIAHRPVNLYGYYFTFPISRAMGNKNFHSAGDG